MWIFYVNRGQCICSMGIQDKQNPIMEFLPANWAYQLVPSQGFRTFIKFKAEPGIRFYEPFQDHYQDLEIKRTQEMHIASSHLKLEEQNESLGLHFRVAYHPIPNERFAGLIRKMTITNTGDDNISFDGLDGLSLIIPFGLSNDGLKHIRRLMEAFVEVKNLENKAPLFKAKVKPSDTPDVQILEAGNFYMGFEKGSDGLELLQPVVDPERIFGAKNDYSFPQAFLEMSREEMLSAQAIENRLPSAMSSFTATLAPGESYEVTSIIGHIASQADLNEILPRVQDESYLRSKISSNTSLISELTQKNMVVSRDSVFDMYVRQNFLDNVLRGGFPYTFKGTEHQTVLHLFSRKHGDLERDYNDYRLTPSPYSQGNGNYRDINQNRRSDLWFNPQVGSSNLEHFINLIQLDGFNPLVLKEVRYALEDESAAQKVLDRHFDPELAAALLNMLREPVSPGELLAHVLDSGHQFEPNADAFLGDLLAVCKKINDTDFAEGYWSDHWHYNLDLLENYLSIFPEALSDILFHHHEFTFHDSAHVVAPRKDKYVIWDGKLMQLESVVKDEEKDHLIQSRPTDKHLVHTAYGQGDVFKTSLFSKFLSIITNKIASLDPSGIGVEMETDKPNWYDALNGLPGIHGSSLSEALEVKRHASFVLEALKQMDGSDELAIFEELQQYATAINDLLAGSLSSFEYWDRSADVKEAYRAETRLGISGNMVHVSVDFIRSFLERCISKIDAGVAKSKKDGSDIPGTYFFHTVTSHELLASEGNPSQAKLNSRGFPCYKANAFELFHLPLFLEGPVHYLRCRPDQKTANAVAQQIRKSGLYDTKLHMYKVNASLDDQAMEIGRARTFSPGWFENESIWLHMEYKYMLELLRSGLHDIFFDDFKNVFIPYLDPETYGRSILENSSFVVSSANPNPGLHGTGFVARLSGATAEFIHILMEMCMGSNPFSLDKDGQLAFSLKPILPAWLFTEKEQKVDLLIDGKTEQRLFPANSFSFMFMSNIMITYHNPQQMHTYGSRGVSPASYTLTDIRGGVHEIVGTALGSQTAKMIRSGEITRIEIALK